MLHLAVILDRAKRRSGLLKPFARGPRGIAARRALAFQHPGFLLLGRGRLPVRVETGMGEGASDIEDRCDGRKERLDRKSTRLNSVTNAHLVCRLLLEKKKAKHY